MHFKIWHKLALILIATTSLTVVISIVLFQQSFKSSFLDYLHQQEQRDLIQISNHLILAYEKKGDWNFIRNNQLLWYYYLQPKTESSKINTNKQNNGKKTANSNADLFLSLLPRKESYALKHPSRELTLLDINKELIVGKQKHQGSDVLNYPVASKGKTIAYIQSKKPTTITDRIDKVFAAKQSQAFIINTLLTLTLSVFIAFLLSFYVRKRINILTTIAQQLTSGQYQKRMPIKQKDELGQLGADFNTLAKTLQKNQQAQQQWIADISHELRTPVSILKGELEALDDGIRPLNTNALVSLKQEVERLNKLIEDLYQLSISDMGALKYNKQDFDFNSLINEVKQSFDVQFSKKKLDFQLNNSTPNPMIVRGDRERLYQLLSNLLNNSLRYTRTGGEVLISVHLNHSQCIVSVEDSAPGVELEKISSIFDRLFRVESSRTRAHGGAGLGLAIARQIVLAHNGNIDAMPSKLGGIKVTFVLPV